MKIPINQLKTCPINSEIYRDSDVGNLVNSIGEVVLLQPIVVTHKRFAILVYIRSTPFLIAFNLVFFLQKS